VLPTITNPTAGDPGYVCSVRIWLLFFTGSKNQLGILHGKKLTAATVMVHSIS